MAADVRPTPPGMMNASSRAAAATTTTHPHAPQEAARRLRPLGQPAAAPCNREEIAPDRSQSGRIEAASSVVSPRHVAGWKNAPAPPPPPPRHAVRVRGRSSSRLSSTRESGSPAIAQSHVCGVVLSGDRPDRKCRRPRASAPFPLDAAALALQTWEYTPTMLNSMPVPVIMTVTVNFTLQ